MRRLRTQFLLVLQATVLAAGLVACSSDSEPDPSTPEVIASAQRDGADLAVRADHSLLSITDRLRVTATATAPGGMVVRSLEIDPEIAGWTTVTRSDPENSMDSSGRAVQTLELVLEPFLAGEYTVPPVTATFTSPGAPGSISLTTTPIAVVVKSVLPDDAALDVLAPAAGPMDPPEIAPMPMNPWPIGSIGVIFIIASAFVLIRVRRRSGREQEPDPVRELVLLRAHPATDPVLDRDRLAAILHRAHLMYPSQAITDLLQRVDHDRYAPPGRYPADAVSEEIDSALAVLGDLGVGR